MRTPLFGKQRKNYIRMTITGVKCLKLWRGTLLGGFLFFPIIDNRVKLCLIALNDYADGMECGKNLSSLKFDEIDDMKERAVSKAIHCLYLELRSRATKHNEELLKKHLAAHQAILKRSLRTMKKEELKLFMDVISE